jgi:FAD:protein FMN transferase
MRGLIIVLLSILLPHAKPFKQYRIEGFAQGTTYRVTYYAADSLLSRAEVERMFDKLDSSLSLYKSYSNINAFNRSATGIAIDEHLKKVVERSLELYRTTHGAFDITVWPLVNAWGFGVNKNNSVPSKGFIDSTMACVGSDKLQLKGTVLHKRLPCIGIDINGIAQGYSVDVLSELLERKGISNYMVEIGGEIRMKGRKQPGNEQMKIGIESPADNPFEVPQLRRIVVPNNCAVTTSGSYRQFYESNGKRITHIIDPRTGHTVQNELISVTVFAKDAMTADAYDNALMVMGLVEGLRFAKLNKITAYFIYRGKEGVLADTATAGFYKLATFYK